MDLSFYLLRNIALGILCVAYTGITTLSHATVYTAIQSGKYKDNSTWQNGAAPYGLVRADSITVAPNVVLDLDTYVIIGNTKSQLHISSGGKIMSSTGQPLYINYSANLTGTGSIELDTMNMATTLSGFTGSITVDKAWIIHLMQNSNATVTINKSLRVWNTVRISDGVFALGADNARILCQNNASISMVNNGQIDFSKIYDVSYEGNIFVAQAELAGSGLRDITIDLLKGFNVVKLTDDLTVKGKLNILNGTLSITNHELHFDTSARFEASAYGILEANRNSVIRVSANNTLDSPLRFNYNVDTIAKLIMNMGNSNAAIKLGTDLKISDSLILLKGKVQCNRHQLRQVISGILVGGSPDSYVITGERGSMARDVFTAYATRLFPVGTETAYLPVAIDSLKDISFVPLFISVIDGVLQECYSGADAAQFQPLVNATWFVVPEIGGYVRYKMKLMWPQSKEVNSFDRNNCYISDYTSNTWSSKAGGAATLTGGLYSITDTINQDQKAFSVFDNNTKVSVNDVVNNTQVHIYPNPVSDVLNIEMNNNKPVHALIYNTTGQVVYSNTLTNNSINIAALPTGVYHMQLFNDDVNTAIQFVKR